MADLTKSELVDRFNKTIVLNKLVVSLVGSESLAAQWWTTPNKAFEGQVPILAPYEHVKEYLIWHCFCAGG